MNLPKRKQIRLQGYDYSQNGAYFITICTYHRIPLFGEIIDDAIGAHLRSRPNEPDIMILKWLFEIQNKYNNVLIDNYIVMPNHIHFIIIITNSGAGTPVSELVKWLKTQTTNEFIKGVKTGLYSPFEKHIWQRNYYEHVIRNDDDLNEIRKYIDENPLKWSLDKYYCS